MSKPRKTLERVLKGRSDANIAFRDVCNLLENLGFTKRVRGSHWHYEHAEAEGIITLQPRRGKCKPYQVRQVRLMLQANMETLKIEGADDADQEQEKSTEG